MTQTMNGNKNEGNSQKLRKPGQRQQERLQRQQRRRRRQRIWTSAIVSVFIIILSVLGITQYQRYNADKAAAAQAHANATATEEAKLNATATAHANATATVLANLQASATASAIPSCLANLHLPPTPTAGPANPPAVTTTPVTLADGLQYIDLRVGCGFPAKSGSTVSIEYTGWLQSTGKKFDSSLDRKGAPFSFQLGQGSVIKGFDEGLMGMKQGGFRRIIIPAALAYGASGSPPTIPANADLIFDVQMLSVK
jgi:FKBP-type peptidyl-prolyl cis-trans isomerase